MGVGLGIGVAVGSGVGVGVGIGVAVGSGCSDSLMGADSDELPQATPTTVRIASAADIAHGFTVIFRPPESSPAGSMFFNPACPVVARSIVVSPVTVNTPCQSSRTARLRSSL